MTNENKNKRYYWIKLKDTFFTSDTVDFLMSQKNGANYVVLYQMLCLKSVNTQGELSRKIGEMIIPFDVDKIHRDCKYFDIDTIRVALELYIRLGLIYEQDNGILQIANFDNMVGSETQGAIEKRQQKQEKLKEAREKKQAVKISSERVLLPDGSFQYIDEKRFGGNGLKALNNAGCMCEVCGETEKLVIHHLNGYSNELKDLIVLCRKCHGKAHSKNGKEEIEQIAKNRNIQGIEQGIEPFYQDNRDKILEIRDKRIDNRDKIEEDDVSDDTTKLQSNSVDYKYIVDSFNTICVSYSKVTKLSENRKKAIRCRVKTYGVDTIIQCFNKAEDSDFLKGKNDKNWSANFDWIMEDRNMAKILDGNYDNKRFADTHSKKTTASPDSEEVQDAYFKQLEQYGII